MQEQPRPEPHTQDIVEYVSVKLYERGKLSLGHAADMAGMAKWDFAKKLADHGVALINHPISEMFEDAAKIR